VRVTSQTRPRKWAKERKKPAFHFFLSFFLSIDSRKEEEEDETSNLKPFPQTSSFFFFF